MNFIWAMLSGVIFASAVCRGWAKSVRSSSSSASCNDPARQHLENLWQMHGAWHESIFQLENMDSVVTNLKDIKKDFVNVKLQALKDSTCPFGSGSKQELEDYRQKVGGKVTLCPSHDMINYDENRIPATLFEKRCSCTQCGFLEDSGRHGHSRHSASSTLGCKPVYYHAKVLRRIGCANNVFLYRATLEPLAVACVCDHESRGDSRRPRVYPRSGKKNTETTTKPFHIRSKS